MKHYGLSIDKRLQRLALRAGENKLLRRSDWHLSCCPRKLKLTLPLEH
jgi:hypothetical protein